MLVPTLLSSWGPPGQALRDLCFFLKVRHDSPHLGRSSVMIQEEMVRGLVCMPGITQTRPGPPGVSHLQGVLEARVPG